jgi:nitronate monooxygenase
MSDDPSDGIRNRSGRSALPALIRDGAALLRTPLCDLLGCEVPVLLAGMGGVARWELAAAVARAGGYPALGMVREPPELIEAEVTALRRATDRPFAVNLIPAATDPDLLEAQIDRCLALGVGAFSFFWDVLPEVIARVKAAGCLVLHQVGTVEAARAAEAAGADVLIAQGIEAGGHVHGRVGAFALAAELLRATSLPVVVSGGIADGRGLAAALAMGAAGVQCGTAFLATDEAFAHEYHKARVVAAGAGDTVLTDIFVLNWPKGAAVRVIANSVTAALDGRLLGHDPQDLPREAIAWDDGAARLRYSTDSPLRTTTGDLEAMALYAGQGAGAIREILPAGDRLRAMAAEAAGLLARRTFAGDRQGDRA